MSSKTFSSSCVQLLARSSVQNLLSCLADHGVEGRLVGGCVRDALLGQAISDIDVAVNASPHVVQQLLEKEGFKVIPTGLKHGTVTVLVEKEAFELTSLRRDVITDGRHATVAYTTDWREDAARRDFTMNALYLSSDGTLADFFGGKADLAQGLVRFIGDPDQRICEDFLRILRYYRFVQRFGGIAQGTLDKRSHAAVRRHNQSLPNLSKERIQSELFKILEHKRPQEIVRLMDDDGIFQALLNDELMRAESSIVSFSFRTPFLSMRNFGSSDVFFSCSLTIESFIHVHFAFPGINSTCWKIFLSFRTFLSQNITCLLSGIAMEML